MENEGEDEDKDTIEDELKELKTEKEKKSSPLISDKEKGNGKSTSAKVVIE